MKEMIYYPGFEVEDKSWLKFALLYFDVLRPIIPYTIQPEYAYLSESFLRVMDSTDFIRPYRPSYKEGTYASMLACEEFERYLSAPKRYGAYFGNPHTASYLGRWKNHQFQNCTLFSGKFSDVFFDFCIKNKIATPCDEGIHISKDLAFVYMSFLADIISKKNEYEMITDVRKYALFLQNKDVQASKTNRTLVKAFKSDITFLAPANLNNIPLQTIIELRNSNGFDESRKAYIQEVEQLITHAEAGEEYSLKKMLSRTHDFIEISEEFVTLTASAIVTFYGLYSLTNGETGSILLPALAETVIGFDTMKNKTTEIWDFIQNIKTKTLARRYVAKIERLNKNV